MRRSAAQTREHVLEVAHELFYWRGIRAVGIDLVASEAGVAPTTLYRLFASKDDLIAAYIARADTLYRGWFDAAVASAGDDPRGAILAVFVSQTQQIEPHQCRGCPFLMALAEFPDPGHPAHRNAVAVKNWVRERFGELASDLARVSDVADAEALADHLTLIMEGTYASTQALGDQGPAARAPAMVNALLPRT